MCTDSFNSHNNIMRKERWLPSVYIKKKGSTERLSNPEWAAELGCKPRQSGIRVSCLNHYSSKRKSPGEVSKLQLMDRARRINLPCRHLCMCQFGGDYLEQSKAKRLTFVPRGPREPRVQWWIILLCWLWWEEVLLLWHSTACGGSAPAGAGREPTSGPTTDHTLVLRLGPSLP